MQRFLVRRCTANRPLRFDSTGPIDAVDLGRGSRLGRLFPVSQPPFLNTFPQTVQNLYGVDPGQTSVCDTLPVFQPGWTLSGDILSSLFNIRLDHDSGDERRGFREFELTSLFIQSVIFPPK